MSKAKLVVGEAAENGRPSFARLEMIVGCFPEGPEAALFEMMLFTGCRVSEIIQMQADDVRSDNCEERMAIRIRSGKVRTVREVSLSGRCLATVKKYLSENPPLQGAPLFRDLYGRPWTAARIRARIRFWANKLDFAPITPYDFRRARFSDLRNPLDHS